MNLCSEIRAPGLGSAVVLDPSDPGPTGPVRVGMSLWGGPVMKDVIVVFLQGSEPDLCDTSWVVLCFRAELGSEPLSGLQRNAAGDLLSKDFMDWVTWSQLRPPGSGSF